MSYGVRKIEDKETIIYEENKKFMVVLLLLTALAGCGTTQEISQDEVPSYFLKPDGYVIARVYKDTAYRWYGTTLIYDCGYITEEDYQAYLNETLTGILIIKHPYDEGKEVAEPVENIKCIEIGTYEDHRGE